MASHCLSRNQPAIGRLGLTGRLGRVLAGGAMALLIAACEELPRPEVIAAPPVVELPLEVVEARLPPRPAPRPRRSRPGVDKTGAPAGEESGTDGQEEPARLPAETGQEVAAEPVAPLSPAAAGLAAPAASLVATSPEKMVGLDAGAMQRWLGAPGVRLQLPPAEVWRYVSQGCLLDVYLYLDLRTREMRVLHYEVIADEGTSRSKDGCYRQILARGAEPAAERDPVAAAGRPN